MINFITSALQHTCPCGRCWGMHEVPEAQRSGSAVQCRSGWNVVYFGEEMENKLYVGNLPYTATEEDLQAHFSGAGTVTSVALIKDRATGRAKGFGFVEMSSAEEAQKAISMFHGQDFMGRTITVNVARPREERPPRGGGRRNY